MRGRQSATFSWEERRTKKARNFIAFESTSKWYERVLENRDTSMLAVDSQKEGGELSLL